MEGIVQLENVYRTHSFTDYKWIDPKLIVVAQWVRMKCMYGCGEYGRNASCPPNVPSILESERFFREYEKATVFHFPKTFNDPGDRHKWSHNINTQLLALEREVFISGYSKAFMLFMDSCSRCKECAGDRKACKDSKRVRPTPEAMGVDVFSTVRSIGYPIEVLDDYKRTMNRYAILMVE
jgi:predicted metal-binding protein